ncbi:MAG: ATP-binding protein [Geminicoccaceae bacterium]
MRRTLVGRSLSAKILLLTMACLFLGEVLIFVPSIAQFRVGYLEERIAAAHLASLGIGPDGAPEMDRADMLLSHAGVLAFTIHGAQGRTVQLGETAPVAATFDLREEGWAELIRDAFGTLRHRGLRLIRVSGPSPQEMGTTVEITLAEAPLWVAMVDYAIRILTVSVILSLRVAGMMIVGLQRMIVRPLARITEAIASFRSRPEDATVDREVTPRADEIGVVEQGFATMRHDLREALTEKTRLAALGAGMSRIGHDRRNILSTAVLISDRLEASADPAVRRVAPRLVETLDRAVRLCGETLDYARSGPPRPQPRPVPLAELVAKVQASLDGATSSITWRVDVPGDLLVEADPDQLFRVLLNLTRNSQEAMGAAGGEIRISARASRRLVTIDVGDTGPGIPERLRQSLFEPFAGSGKPGGNGIGLAICRELVQAHGGEIELVGTSDRGTTFRVRLPARTGRGKGGRKTRMKLERVATIALLPLLGLAACGYQGPAVAGYPGLQNKIMWYYENNALEQNATCTRARMRSITGAQVIDETPQTVVMNIRYYWYDEGQRDFDDSGFGVFAPGPINRCNGFAERTFTFVKMTDGSLQVRSMTGPQRRPPT